MILDHASQLRKYEALYPGAAAAADFLETITVQTPSGRHEILNDQVYAIVQRYETQSAQSRVWECHDRYLDIQYLLSGTENIFWATREQIRNWSEYSQTGDSQVSPDCQEGTALHLHPGEFAIFAPQDAHKPGCFQTVSEHVIKVVVKIRCR